MAGASFQLEHIRPRVAFPTNDPAMHDESNLAWSCSNCNRAKWDQVRGIDPRDGSFQRLFNPRIDAWDDCFYALRSGQILGKNPIGRATVEALRFNANPDAVQSRAEHFELKIWPSQ